MISYIKGILEDMSPGMVVVDNHGIGYQMMVPMRGESFPKIGQEIKIYTHMHVREDDVSLFGFLSKEEKEAFELLIGVNGIGPKVGLSVLSTLSVYELKMAVISEDVKTIPNIPEAEILCGMEIHTEEDMVAAAKAIYEDLGCAVLLKGGHNINDANDLLYTKEEVSWFKGKRINNPNTHGTGCTLSSAIAANLAKGFDLKISVQRAKDYISRALADMLDLGAGSGPMNHAFDLKDEWKEEA